jgi:hypothetical protein
MRYAVLIAATILSSAPAMAQDRTPPAGSIRALEAPVDARPSQFDRAYGTRAPFEGRSAYDRTTTDQQPADRR